MSLIKTHITQKNETLNSISNYYSCPIEKILLLNPLFKYRKPTIGQIVYVEIIEENNKKQIKIAKSSLNIITKLFKDDLTSYINQFNDHILIENELYSEYQKIIKEIFIEENDQEIFLSQLKSLHKLYHSFIDVLKNKNEIEINHIKQEIKNNIININNFLTNKNIDIDIKKINAILEQRILIIIKLINNNYYDVYQTIKKDYPNE